jgi:hypothetical protein
MQTRSNIEEIWAELSVHFEALKIFFQKTREKTNLDRYEFYFFEMLISVVCDCKLGQ